MMRAARIAFLAMIAVALTLVAAARADEERFTLATRPGVTERVLLTRPAGAPVASVILFTGGNGLLYAPNGERLAAANNFLIRSREKFAAAGFLVASVDAPSDHPHGLAGFRSSEDSAQDVAALIAELRHRAEAPVWLVGTSMGTISAANAAARLSHEQGADGLVLTSTIVVQNRGIAPVPAAVPIDRITMPTLFVHNRDDACPLCSFAAVAPTMALFTHAVKKELIAVEGGTTPLSEPCEALSRHGYIGIEDQVIDAIARWIKA